jgi:hypothetical protein
MYEEEDPSYFLSDYQIKVAMFRATLSPFNRL